MSCLAVYLICITRVRVQNNRSKITITSTPAVPLLGSMEMASLLSAFIFLHSPSLLHHTMIPATRDDVTFCARQISFTTVKPVSREYLFNYDIEAKGGKCPSQLSIEGFGLS